jgi:hypothetical protein
MKLYIIANREDKVRWYNLDGSYTSGNRFSVISLKAFIRKKDAEEYIVEKKMGRYWHIRAVEVLENNRREHKKVVGFRANDRQKKMLEDMKKGVKFRSV